MGTLDPEMRAALTHSLVRGVAKLPAPDRDAVHAAVGTEDLERVDSALPIAWLPMDLHMKIADAVRDTIGSERARPFWEEVMQRSLDRPILRPFVSMTVKVFGADPAAFFRRSPMLYVHLTRNLGTVEFDSLSQTQSRVTLRGFPSRAFRFVCYVEGLQGCLDAFYPLCRTVGRTQVESWDDARGDVSYLLTWDA